MAWPGTISVPTETEGIGVPCPELRGFWWWEDLPAPVPPSQVISDKVAIIYRKDITEGGYAVCSVAVDEDGFPGVQVEMILEGVWDVLLVDSFEDDICAPDWDQNDPFSESHGFYVGHDSSQLLYLTKGNRDRQLIVGGFLRPNPVAPGGLMRACLFRNLYMAVESSTGGWIQVIPIVNGERLVDEAVTFAVPMVEGERVTHRFEVPLTRKYQPDELDLSRAGIVGTWFTCEIHLKDPFGCGYFEISGMELEYEVLEDYALGLAYTGETLALPVRDAAVTWFLGMENHGLLQGGEGALDDDAPIPVRIETNPIAPAGVGGEVLFRDLYLAVVRDNREDWTVTVTPIVDGEELVAEQVTFAGVPAAVSEVRLISPSQPYMAAGMELSRYHPRGAWIAFRIEAPNAPDGFFSFDGPELEYEVLTEDLKDVTNA